MIGSLRGRIGRKDAQRVLIETGGVGYLVYIPFSTFFSLGDVGSDAALLIHTTEDYPFLSLRVDDHSDPLAELRRLYAVSLERFQPFMGCLPSRAQPAGITDRAVIEERIAQFHAARAKG